MIRVRPGARFTCHGDGLCCADVHTFGPLDDREARTLRAIDAQIVIVSDEGDRLIRPTPDGRCVFLGDGVCELHARLGAAAKPLSCGQFPYVLIQLPDYARGVTDHRCPCRTMGERAPVTPERVAAACPGAPDRTLTGVIARDDERAITIEEYEALEAPLLERLETEDPLDVLGRPPLPATEAKTLAFRYLREGGGSRFAVALHRFGRAALRVIGLEVDPPDPALPWADAFDRAEARSEPRDAEEMLRDWVADYLWSLEHVFLGTFEDTRVELGLRVRVARQLAAEREAEGARADRAMAEAIACCELAGIDDDYREMVGGLASED